MSDSYSQSIHGNNNQQDITIILPEPLRVFSGDLRELIVAFRGVVPSSSGSETGYHFADIEAKNQKNLMDVGYFKSIVEEDLPYFKDIDDFLQDPRSSEHTDMYEATAKDLQIHFLANKKRFGMSVHKFLAYSYGTIFENLQLEVRKDRGKIRTFLHHMYWNCSIGIR